MPIYNKFTNGEGQSAYDESGFDQLQNVDIHSTLGTVQSQLDVENLSDTIDEQTLIEVVPTGDVYFLSIESGKIWKRAIADGAITLAHTNTNGLGRGIKYYNGKLYYWTASKLGHFNLSSPWTDTFATFSGGDARHSLELNLTLWICDSEYIASVNSSGTFSANSLDLPPQYTGVTLTTDSYNLLIGAFIGSNVAESRVFLWDTYSDSWTSEDPVDEVGINCWINADGISFASCGTEGNIYYWSGTEMVFFNKIRGITPTRGGSKSTTYQGRPLFASNNYVYSLHRSGKDQPIAIAREYSCNGTISDIMAHGSYLFISHSNGVDLVNSDMATGVVQTPIYENTFNNVIVSYVSLPAGTSIGISTAINGGAFSEQTAITDTVNKKVYFDGGLADAKFGQAKVTLNPHGSFTPVITSIELK